MTRSQNARRPSIAIDRTHICAVSCSRSIRRSSRRSSRCCGRRARFRISKWIVAAMIVAAPAFASDRFEKTLSGTVTYDGGRVLIEHRFGRVSVHTGGGNQVIAHATVRASDADLGRQVRFNVSNASDGVVIRTQFPSIHMHGENMSYDADLDVTIPDRAPLVLHSEFGTVEVSGLRAPAQIINRQGSITVRDIHGGEIENSFGSINVDNSDGETSVRNANGAIK